MGALAALYPLGRYHLLRLRGTCRISGMAALLTVLLVLLGAVASGCGASDPLSAPTSAPPGTSSSPASVSEPTPLPATPSAPALESLRLTPVLTGKDGLEFVGLDSPTNLVQAQNGQVLVSDQAGLIVAFEGEALSGEIEHIFYTEFLDIRDIVSRRGSEEGLLGLALDPGEGGHVYVYYSAANPRRSVVSRFSIQGSSSSADPGSELVILEVEQPYSNHNGGQIAFGPDGYLYIGLGDGGSAGDPKGNGQDTSTLLGSVLRIDVSESTAGRPYAIPPDNPFADGGGRPEVWAYGLRNPWRFSFDRETGDLWAGDVGQNQWEEIDIIERGGNYGWNTLEGNHCFNPPDGCDREGRIPPVWEYSLDGTPCSVIGGHVYRGQDIPWLAGAYIYGDFCSGKVFGLRYADGQVTERKELADTGLRIMSFAEDSGGELYLLSQGEGVYRLEGEGR